MLRSYSLLLVLITALGCSSSGSTSGTDGPSTCPTGSETCSCYGNGTCDAGLTCLSNICVMSPDTSGGTGTGGTTNAGGGQSTGGIADGTGGGDQTTNLPGPWTFDADFEGWQAYPSSANPPSFFGQQTLAPSLRIDHTNGAPDPGALVIECPTDTPSKAGQWNTVVFVEFEPTDLSGRILTAKVNLNSSSYLTAVLFALDSDQQFGQGVPLKNQSGWITLTLPFDEPLGGGFNPKAIRQIGLELVPDSPDANFCGAPGYTNKFGSVSLDLVQIQTLQ